MSDKLLVRFEGLDISEEGVSLDDLQKTLRHVQNAFRYMVRHVAGYSRGRQPEWLRKESELRLTGTSPGSLVAELSVASTDELNESNRPGQEAIALLLEEEGVDLWPERVTKEWFRIGQDLSPQIDIVSLEHPSSGHRREFQRDEDVFMVGAPALQLAPTMEKALLYGRLRAVDWVERTAKLVPYQGRPVNLRFDADNDRQMLALAMQFVEVRGQGEFDHRDQWRYIQVENIQGTRSWNEPFELDTVLSVPNPKVFDPDEVVRASEPFDVDDFLQFLNDSRDEGME